MLPDEILTVTFDRDQPQTATLSCKASTVISVIGCSTNQSVILDEPVYTFTIILPDTFEKKGVIAIRSGDVDARAFLLTFEHGVLFPIDLSVTWTPIDGRIGQIYPDGALVVMVDGISYGTDPLYCDHVIDDPNLLCKYLSGDVDSTALIATAQQALRDTSEIEKLRDELADMRSAQKVKIWELEKSLAHAHTTIKDLLDEIVDEEKCSEKLERSTKSIEHLKLRLERAERFISAIDKIAYTHSLHFRCAKSMQEIRQRLSYYWN